MTKIKLTLITSSLVLVIAYSNCSQPGEIALKNGPAVVATEATVKNILSSCANAAATGKLLTSQQNINFDDSRVETQKANICEFAAAGAVTLNGNLEMHDSFMQSRYEQSRSLNLPEGSVICDIEMKNSLQSFRYDDVFFFTFNGFLLATNDKTAMKEKLRPASVKLADNEFTDIYTYDWTKLRTGHFENVADDYCLGATEGLSTCAWPVSEQPGKINFSFAPSLLIGISAGIPAQQHKFGFAITGDNDPSLDCYHEKLEFLMNVKYYIP